MKRGNSLKIALGADHNGIELKTELFAFLKGCGHDVIDFGATEIDPEDDYPDLTVPVAHSVAAGNVDRGIVICGSGVGAAIAANKVFGVRASVCHDTYSARQGVEHDDMNVLCLGSRIIGDQLARELVTQFVGARLDPHPRFKRRLKKINALEKDSVETERSTRESK